MFYSEDDGQTYNEIAIEALDSMAIGTIVQFVGTTIPNGWLECDGSTITQSTYPELYDLIGGTLPDFRGRVLVGQDTNDTDFDTIGETGGSKYLQEHSHNMAWTGGSQTTSRSTISWVGGQTAWQYVGTDSAGTGNSGNLQPYAVVKHIIKAFSVVPTMAGIVNQYSTSTEDGYACDYVNKHYGGVVLYDNSTGTTSDVSLTMPTGETLSDYSYIEIYAITDDNEYFYTKAPSVVNRNVVIAMTHYYDNVVYTYVKSFKINASSLTINTTISGGGYYGGGMGVNNRDNISVVKVIGYK